MFLGCCPFLSRPDRGWIFVGRDLLYLGHGCAACRNFRLVPCGSLIDHSGASSIALHFQGQDFASAPEGLRMTAEPAFYLNLHPGILCPLTLADKMIDYWIQRADFSLEDHYDSEPAEIMNALVNIDWDALIAERIELQNQGEICGYPGLGIVFGNGEIIHLLEPENSPYKGLFHYYTERKILGVFPVDDSYTASFGNLTEENLWRILTNWKAGQHDETIELLQAKVT